LICRIIYLAGCVIILLQFFDVGENNLLSVAFQLRKVIHGKQEAVVLCLCSRKDAQTVSTMSVLCKQFVYVFCCRSAWIGIKKMMKVIRKSTVCLQSAVFGCICHYSFDSDSFCCTVLIFTGVYGVL